MIIMIEKVADNQIRELNSEIVHTFSHWLQGYGITLVSYLTDCFPSAGKKIENDLDSWTTGLFAYIILMIPCRSGM